MSKQKNNGVSAETANASQANAPASVEQIAEQTAKPTGTDVLTRALNAGLITQEQFDKVSGIINDDFMAGYVAILSADIKKREQDVLGQAYLAIENAMNAEDMTTVKSVMMNNSIKRLTIECNESGVFNVLRSSAGKTHATPSGERTHAGKYVFTNGTISHESLAAFSGMKGVNGQNCLRALKKQAGFNANDWTVVNQDSKEVTPLAVWSVSKYDVKFD